MKLHSYIFFELLTAFVFTLGGILVLALPAITAAAVHKLAGVEILHVLLYIPLIVAGLIPYVLPLAYLLSVVHVYGRLAADNEWTALRMSGRNPLEMFLPGAVLAAVLGLTTWWLLAEKLPEIRFRQSNFATAALAETTRHIAPGRTEVKIKDFYVSAVSREGDDFVDAYVHIPSQKPGEEDMSVRADRVRFSSDENNIYAQFINARSVIGGQEVRLGEPVVRIDLDALRRKAGTREKPRYMSSVAMRAKLDAGKVEPDKIEMFRFEIQYRRALAATCFMFLLLGAPTALMFRRGAQLLPLAIAVGYALIYYVLSMRLGPILSEGRAIAPELAAWAVVILGLVAGVFLTRKALSE
ncbi:MAG: LptF/LptG family permease [Planctomycetota bacterium]|nr:LptF/LptG family permease [Planctomycetota bacterium]